MDPGPATSYDFYISTLESLNFMTFDVHDVYAHRFKADLSVESWSWELQPTTHSWNEIQKMTSFEIISSSLSG